MLRNFSMMMRHCFLRLSIVSGDPSRSAETYEIPLTRTLFSYYNMLFRTTGLKLSSPRMSQDWKMPTKVGSYTPPRQALCKGKVRVCILFHICYTIGKANRLIFLLIFMSLGMIRAVERLLFADASDGTKTSLKDLCFTAMKKFSPTSLQKCTEAQSCFWSYKA